MQPNAAGELGFYDPKGDPCQPDNRYPEADPAFLHRLSRRLAALWGCSGTGYREAEGANSSRMRILGGRCGGLLGVTSKPKRALTRRDFLKVAGAGAAGATMLGAAGCRTSLTEELTQMPEEYLPSGGPGMNVVLVVLDSLRKDHVGAYGNDW
ncbi:MAG TPA: twin-arginine translocation signal domain-containing protein, partial [Rubrobacter sp.]|nr:twin-arginine translocation signal domain-containing protein [Rubrobacter sp.]